MTFATIRAGLAARRPNLVILLVATLVALVLPTAASAASVETTIHVRNEAGRDQVNAAVVFSDGFVDYTDEYGELRVRVSPGETFRVRRGRSVPSNCQAPPEGWSGKSATVPAGAVEGQVIEVTLPNIVGAQHFEAASSAERGFVGIVNDERERRGRAGLRISEPLMAQAQMYAIALDKQRGNLKPCETYPHIQLISSDLGFSSVLGQEGLFGVGGSTATPAMAADYFLSNNEALLTNRAANAIGVASVGGGSTWVVVLDSVSQPCDRAACVLTEDTGDSSLAGGGSSGDPAANAATIRLKRAFARGKKVKLSFVARSVRGKVKATIRSTGGEARRVRIKGSGRKRRAALRLDRGRWKLSAQATGTDGDRVQRCWSLRVKKREVAVRSARCRSG